MSYRPETIEMVARVLTPAIWLTASEIRLCLPQPLALGTVRNVLEILLSQNRALSDAGRPAHGGRANRWYRGPGRSR